MNRLAVTGGVAIGVSLVGTGVMIAEVKGLRSDLTNVRNKINELQEETEVITHEDDAPEHFHNLWLHMKTHFGI